MAGEIDRQPDRKRDRMKAFAKRYMTVPLAIRTSDLQRRAASAAVMMAAALGALWLGGLVLDLFIIAVAAATYFEFARLILRIEMGALARVFGWLAGAAYIVAAAYVLVSAASREAIVLIVGCVVFVDTFAYGFGRTFGGPKIAPKISPSKTWAGLGGGVVGATTALVLFLLFSEYGSTVTYRPPLEWALLVVPGAMIAVLAQAGDFFESWLKRKAKMKDSSNLIPGHGGVFDRTDGILPVAIFFGAVFSTLAPHWIDL